jgi:protein gp37
VSDGTAIEWTEATWNPTTGCTEISAGCDHCYARTLAEQLQKMGAAKYKNGFAVTLHPSALD